MRIIMMGTGPFAIPTFRAIHAAAPHEVIALITRPPQPRRGKRKSSPAPPNPMESVGLELGLRIEMPSSINDPASIELLAELNADLFVVCDYGQILSAAALGAATLGGINLHASLLPAYRGAAPINWAMYDGCKQTGVTVIHMTRRLDAGPNLVQRTVTIQPKETAIELEERLAVAGAEAILEAIQMLHEWDGESELGEKQNSAAATKAPRLKKSDGEIDWSRSAQQIVNQLYAFMPWPGSFTHWLRPDGEALRIAITSASLDPTLATDSQPVGTVIETESCFAVATGEGAFIIETVQPAGRKEQPSAAFLRGYRLQKGSILGSPSPQP